MPSANYVNLFVYYYGRGYKHSPYFGAAIIDQTQTDKKSKITRVCVHFVSQYYLFIYTII